MKIACLGWGSLIWRPDNLLIRREWFADGVLLPIEFARQSKDGRLTLVITDTAKPIRTLWALMATDDLPTAKKSLLTREAIPEKKLDTFIASITAREETVDRIKLTIQSWANNLKLDAVIWTNLPPKFQDTDNRVPTSDETIAYINSLDINARATAEEYIRRTPKQIDTEYRRKFETEFGWTHIA
jgi:hypothetical protein